MIPLLLAQSSAVSCQESAFLLLIMFGVFWFMYIRPTMKEQAKQKEWVSGLKKGDEVVTTGGLVGRIHAVAADVVTIELAKDVRVRVVKDQVQRAYKEAPAPAAEPPKEPPAPGVKPEKSKLDTIAGWLRGDARPSPSRAPESEKPSEEVKK